MFEPFPFNSIGARPKKINAVIVSVAIGYFHIFSHFSPWDGVWLSFRTDPLLLLLVSLLADGTAFGSIFAYN